MASGTTALMYAAGAGGNASMTVMGLLLDRGADPRRPNKAGRTDLMVAAMRDCAECVNVLLNKGAEIAARDKLGRDALSFAASSGTVNALQTLLVRGSRINARAENGWTALMSAADAGKPLIVKALLERGADPAFEDMNRMTALKLARKKGWGATAMLLSPNEWRPSAAARAVQGEPSVETAEVSGSSATPPGLIMSCGQQGEAQAKSCPVLRWGGYTYRTCTFPDYAGAIGVVAYDPAGKVARQWVKHGPNAQAK